MTDCSGEGEGLLGGWKPITADEEDWRGLKWAPILTRKMMHGWQLWHPCCVSWLQNRCSFFLLFMVAETNQTVYCSLTFLALFFFVVFYYFMYVLQEEMFIPLPLQLQTNQAGNACLTKALHIPGSKSEIQQITVSKWTYSFIFSVEVNVPAHNVLRRRKHRLNRPYRSSPLLSLLLGVIECFVLVVSAWFGQ